MRGFGKKHWTWRLGPAVERSSSVSRRNSSETMGKALNSQDLRGRVAYFQGSFLAMIYDFQIHISKE